MITIRTDTRYMTHIGRHKIQILAANLVFVDLCKAFDSANRGNMRRILISHGTLKEVLDAIMVLYQNSHSLVRSSDGE